MTHSPEPWGYNDDFCRDSANSIVWAYAWHAGEDHLPSEENARRIVACVNFCRGVPTYQLEAGVNLDQLMATVRAVKKVDQQVFVCPPGWPSQ